VIDERAPTGNANSAAESPHSGTINNPGQTPRLVDDRKCNKTSCSVPSIRTHRTMTGNWTSTLRTTNHRRGDAASESHTSSTVFSRQQAMTSPRPGEPEVSGCDRGRTYSRFSARRRHFLTTTLTAALPPPPPRFDPPPVYVSSSSSPLISSPSSTSGHQTTRDAKRKTARGN